jgi:V8-like Glu-specific endopeptidase
MSVALILLIVLIGSVGVGALAGLPARARAQKPAATQPERARAELIEAQVRAYRARLYFASDLHLPTFTQKVIYGSDDRNDVLHLRNSKDPVEKMAAELARSTCLLTSQALVQRQADGSYKLKLQPFEYEKCRPCSEERFGGQKVGGWCSGFLVGPDLVATAGHCCDDGDVTMEKTAFVFGFFATDPVLMRTVDKEQKPEMTTTPGVLAAEQVYFGKKVVKWELSDSGDFTIVQLDRKVTFPGARPAQLRRAGDPKVDQRVGLVGYPSGLPAKAAYGANTKIYDVGKVWLRSNLDSYGGNSGSPVTDENGVVEGILVRGRDDYDTWTDGSAGKCFYSFRKKDSDAGEIVTRTSVFVAHIPAPDAPPKP